MPESETTPAHGAEILTEFVRNRGTMLVRGDLGPLFVDHYLHLADHRLQPAPEHDALFKQALAAFALHCCSRPRFEHLAWTVGLQAPRLNLFLAGDNEDCTVTGRLFTENVREAEKKVFYSDLLPKRGAEKRRSVVNFHGTDLFRAVETYYATSEQRLARFFDLGDDHFALLISHPDCDEAWLRRIEVATVKEIDRTDTVVRIERRAYRWNCGCDQRKILGALAPAARENFTGLFAGDESVTVQCPRCAAAHVVTREAMEAYLAATKK